MTWANDIPGLLGQTQSRLSALPPLLLPRGSVLFHPGEAAKGFVVVLSGQIEVFLTSSNGREILLYSVEPGQSCIQTTLGLIGDEDYSGEALAASDVRIVLIPKPVFLSLMDEDAGFRGFVLAAFGRRMNEVTRLLERVAFGRVESRLAAALLELSQDGQVHATQSDLAARIGSAREVVTRRLDTLVRAGLVTTDRGVVHLHDPDGLRRLAAQDGPV